MKEYLLLRNNVQSGPYSFAEIKAMGLKAFDLIWVENKSFSWRYPSEINELAPLAPPVEPTLDRALERAAIKAEMVSEDKSVITSSNLIKEVEHNPLPENETTLAPVKNIKHVVAFKPQANHIDIKTIKSTQQPKVVKVQVREKDFVHEKQPETDIQREEKHSFINNDFIDNTSDTFQPAREPEVIVEKQSIYKTAANAPVSQVAANSNRLEIAVLLVGALSLLAVGYLLLTSSY